MNNFKISLTIFVCVRVWVFVDNYLLCVSCPHASTALNTKEKEGCFRIVIHDVTIQLCNTSCLECHWLIIGPEDGWGVAKERGRWIMYSTNIYGITVGLKRSPNPNSLCLGQSFLEGRMNKIPHNNDVYFVDEHNTFPKCCIQGGSKLSCFFCFL